MSLKVGVIGQGTMGSNLSLNIGSKHPTYIFNRTVAKSIGTKNRGIEQGIRVDISDNFVEMMYNLKNADRGIIVSMLPSGKASDNIIMTIASLLKDNYIDNVSIIDGSNENYKRSSNRSRVINQMGIPYMGVGISGGSVGARNGPCMMVGGSKATYDAHKDFFDSISPSNIHIDGDRGNGHLIKSIHNGIEYVMMQCIGEVYHIYSHLGFSRFDIVEKFKMMRDSAIGGFLLDTTIDALSLNDVDTVQDVSDFNETCKWTVEYALANDIYAPSIAASLNSRIGSSYRNVHTCPIETNDTRPSIPVDFDSRVLSTIEFVYSAAFSQAELLIDKVDTTVSTYDIFDSWKTGTIILCNGLGNVLNDHTMFQSVDDARYMANFAIKNKIPIPSISESITYCDTVNSHCIPSSQVIQIQRSTFGSHPMNYF